MNKLIHTARGAAIAAGLAATVITIALGQNPRERNSRPDAQRRNAGQNDQVNNAPPVLKAPIYDFPINLPPGVTAGLGQEGSGGGHKPKNRAPEHHTFNWTGISMGNSNSILQITGWTKLVTKSDGSWTYSGHMHNAGWMGYNVITLVGVKAANGKVYLWSDTVKPGGTYHLQGTNPAPRNANWSASGTSDVIGDDWRQWFDVSKAQWKGVCSAVVIGSPNPKPKAQLESLTDDLLKAFGAEGETPVQMHG